MLLAAMAVLPVLAQDDPPPLPPELPPGPFIVPLPILFEGTVELHGFPVAEGELTVRIGDWESRAVPVVDGAFACAAQCLIAGPSGFEYVDQQLTFHLDGRHEGDVAFAFPNLGEPDQRRVELRFGSPTTPTPPLTSTPPPTSTPTPPPTPTPAPTLGSLGPARLSALAVIVVALGVAAAVGTAVVRRRLRGR